MGQTTILFVQLFVIWTALGVGAFVGFVLCALFTGARHDEFKRRTQAYSIAAKIKAERKAHGMAEWSPNEK